MKIADREIGDLANELRGRQAAIETVMFAFMAHLAAHFDDPTKMIRQVMADAEASLEKMGDAAKEADEKHIAAYAITCFQNYSANMLAHVTKVAPTGTKQ